METSIRITQELYGHLFFKIICDVIPDSSVDRSAILFHDYIVVFANSDYVFTGRPVPWRQLSTIAIKMFASTLGIVAIQYWLSLSFKSFVTPIGIGMALLTGGLMIRQWEYISYYPYMHPLLIYFPNPGLEEGTMHKTILNSIAESVIVLGLGFYHVCIRKEKG
jgi:hypothetical protein